MSLSVLICNAQTAVISRRSRQPESRRLLVLELIMRIFSDIKLYHCNNNNALPSRCQLVYRNQLHQKLDELYQEKEI